jgi:hypothetical protein
MNYRNIIILFLTSIFITTTFAQECPDLDPAGYGSCDMWLGYGWTGENCIGISGCDLNGDEAWFFQTIEECLSSCDTLGDLNSDGYLDILDIVIMVNIVLGNITPTDSQLWSGDINSDDIINVLDIIALVNIILNSSQEDRDTWQIIQEDILTPRCISCHETGTYFAQISGLVLTPDSAYSQLIDTYPTNMFASEDGLVRVSSDSGMYGLQLSFLWEKINAPNEEHFHSEHPFYGGLMPLGAPYLTNGQLAFIEKWILEGAPEEGIVADPSLLVDNSVYEPPEFVELEPPESGYQYHVGPFEVPPQQEKEFLYYVPPLTTEDMFIERVQISMRPGSHHFIMYTFNNIPEFYLPEPYTIRDLHDGYGNYYQENILAMLFHKFVTGTQWPALDYHFPPGVALRIPPDFGFDLNSHYPNYTDEVIIGEVFTNIHTIPLSDVEHVAEILMLNNTDFSLPPNAVTTLERTYMYNEVLDVSGLNPEADLIYIFQLFSHAHEHMLRFDIELVDATGESELIYSALDWEHPPILEINPPLILNPGQGLKMVVTFDNWTNDFLNFGLLSVDEMMIIFGYVYTD